MHTLKKLVLGLTLAGVIGTAQAALIDRGGGVAD